ncbi:mRNA surveillance protein pelota [Cryptococcus amylolentus CBS 6039]|uniref:Protein DOM34 homolog n=2 Tax=Cryptococcus amylolentus TaxID=104669 RepID=A0A1E3HUR2_9TREE|nr:mRNA surveillance protein pelota [Cryptococcus amylolentus CBS 6039]ODN79875.1 mRNA surveillance protein pelota [Cryptococcus amylolentus CBS 6039]ODO08140.1 mRNA surveillance protein pelota [Cryptococcus amylolentus CBS 6273]
MKLVNKHIEKDGSGYVTLRPEDDEDMWHVYNLISEGDQVRAMAVRRVQTVSSTGSSDSHRVRTNLTIQVTKTDFQSAASSSTSATGQGERKEPTASLQISGQVVQENEFVKMGAFHTLDLEANRDFRLSKAIGWDSIALERIQESTQEGRGAEVGAIVCGEGTAAICLLSEHMTTVRQRIDMPVPRKRKGGTSGHDKAVDNYHSTVYNAILRLIPFQSLKAIVIASPGFTKDALYEYIFQQATLQSNKALLASRSKWIKVHSNTSHVHGLVEALKAPEVAKMLAGAKFAREGAGLDKFHRMLATDELRAWYGPEHVALAVDRGAVGTLLISDDLFRSSDPAKRNHYVHLVEAVRAHGGEALIFSSMHESGQQLNLLTGIAAVLTYPLDIEVVEMEEREEKERLEKEKLEQMDNE